MKAVPLRDVADVNPRANGKPANDENVSFVPMAHLSAEAAETGPGDPRPFGEVSKGYTVFRDRDLLVAKITPCFENNKIGQAKLRHPIGVGSSEFHVIRPKADVLDARFLLHFLRQDRVRLEGERRMTGSGGQRRVPPAFLKELKVPLPSLDEQRRIAEILDKADGLRSQRRRMLAYLDELPQSIFRDMFGAGGPGWKPSVSLAEVVRDGTIVTYGIVQAGPEFPGGVPYIRTGDLVDGGIRKDQLRHTDPAIAERFERSRVKRNDIVMSIRATVGTTALVPESLEGANLTQGTARISPGSDVLPDFLFQYLRSPAVQSWIQGQVKGATFREITLARLRELIVSRPPISLQRDFSVKVQSIAAQRASCVTGIGRADELFGALQQRAFSGQL